MSGEFDYEDTSYDDAGGPDPVEGADTYADDIVDNTLDALRQQEDDKQTLILEGREEFQTYAFGQLSRSKAAVDAVNAQYLLDANDERHLIVGPITFSTSFASTPAITYGQTAFLQSSQVVESNRATHYTPFLCMPYTYKLRYTNGQVDGFWIGLYALTPPPAQSSLQTVEWIAKGFATRYREVQSDESWTENYDQNDASYLDDTDTDSYDNTDIDPGTFIY